MASALDSAMEKNVVKEKTHLSFCLVKGVWSVDPILTPSSLNMGRVKNFPSGLGLLFLNKFREVCTTLGHTWTV